MVLTEWQRENCERTWEKYKPEVEKLCRFKLQSSPSAIEDVVAQTFLDYCESCTHTEAWNPRGYLLKIANTLIKKEYDKASFEKGFFKIINEEELVEFSAIQLDEYVIEKLRNEKISKETVNEIISELTEREKDIVKLRYMEKLSWKKVAKQLDISESNARIINYRLVKKINSLIKEKVKFL